MALLLPFLVVALSTDIAWRRIPNLLIVVMLGCGVAIQAMFFGTDGVVASLGGIMIGFSMLLPLYVVGGMGAGDVKLLAAAGSFLGPWGTIIAGALTLLAGGVLALVALAWLGLRASRATQFSAAEPAPHTDARRVQLPYSLAVGAGSLLAAYQLGLATPFVPTLMDMTKW
jgi:prepilin peptidase CpaA